MALIVACGGKAVIDPPLTEPGGGGEGGATVVSVTTTTTTATTTTGGGGAGGGIPRGGAPPIPPLVEEPVGLVPSGEPFVFEVPPNTLGFTAIGQIQSDDELAAFYSVTAPDTTLVADEFGMPSTSFYFGQWGIGAVAVPQSDHAPAMPLMTGPWTLVPTSGDESPIDVSVWRRQTIDGAFHGGVVDVNVFIANGAVAQSYASEVMATAFDDFAGLDLGTVSFFTVPASFALIHEQNYLAVFKETAGAPGKPALNVIYVQEISFGALGYSPGAPAVPLIHGTHLSGVVMLPTGVAEDAHVLRHEAGHLAGLAHTSETILGFGDRLADTPFCPDVINIADSCPDVDYLMFPFATPGSALILSPQQEVVIQASALYRGAVEPQGGFPEPLPTPAANLTPAPPDGGRAAVHPPQTTAGPWRDRHPRRLVDLATAHWCQHHAPGAAPPDGTALLRRHASEAELWALAADAGAPGHARARALRAAAAAPLEQRELAWLTRLGRDERAPRRLRSAALEQLAAAGHPLPEVQDPILRRLHGPARSEL